MTAFKKYARVESTGLWRETPQAEPRSVGVRFGDASLVLLDDQDAPLSHWALAGMRIVEHNDGVAIYTIDADNAETLSLSDPVVITAIDEIQAALHPKPAKLQKRSVIALWIRRVALLLALGCFALLGYHSATIIRQQAIYMMPPARAEELGDRMVLALMETGAHPCQNPPGMQALAKIAAHVLIRSDRLHVLDVPNGRVASFPGGTIVLDPDLFTQPVKPERIAGWMSTGNTHASLEVVLRSVTLLANLRYVLTGELPTITPEQTLDLAAQAIDTQQVLTALYTLEQFEIQPDAFWEDVNTFMHVDKPAQLTENTEASTQPILPDRDRIALADICQ